MKDCYQILFKEAVSFLSLHGATINTSDRPKTLDRLTYREFKMLKFNVECLTETEIHSHFTRNFFVKRFYSDTL